MQASPARRRLTLGRNPHRAGDRWLLPTVRSILANPRYTGHQVWNRQPTSHELIDPGNTGLGHRQVQRWAQPDGWVISTRPSHPSLVSEEDFVAVQGIRAERDHAGPAEGRTYALAGLLHCGICGRRLESCWANNRPAYRCRHGYSSAVTPDPARPENVYIREDQILPHLPALLPSAEPAGRRRRRTGRGVEVSSPVSGLDVIGYLRAREITLTYDPQAKTLLADTPEAPVTVIGNAS
jgi:site-specific DNA recombinase